MGYTFNNNQPIVFNYDNGFCGTEQREYCLLKEPSDKISVQFKLNPNTTNLVEDSTMTASAQLLTNPSILSGDGGWTFTGNFAQVVGNASKSAGAAGTLYQAVPGIAAGKIYYVRARVQTNTTGSMTFSIGGVTASTDFGTATGSYYVSGYFQAVNTNNLIFSANSAYVGLVFECFVYEVPYMIGAGTDWTDNNSSTYVDSWESGTQACHVQGNTTNLFPLLSGGTFNLTDGGVYKIVIKVSNMTAGTLTINFGGTTAGTITQNGNYTFTSNASVGFIGTILALAPSANFDGCIDDLYLYDYNSYFNAAIFDLNDNWLQDIPESYYSQSGEWVYIEATATQLGLEEGCYRICLTENTSTDPVVELVQNGGFPNKEQWTYNAPGAPTAWTFSNAAIGKIYNAELTLQIGQLLIGDACWIGKELTLTFDLQLITGNGQLTFKAYGYNTSTIYTTQVYTGNDEGQKSITFTVTDDTQVVIFFEFEALEIEEPGAYEQVTFTDVSCFDLGCNLVYPYCSNCISVKSSFDCSKNLSWYNTKNSFGFNYANATVNPTFELRILCQFEKWKHKQNWNVWKNYNLNSSIAYADSSETFEVRTEMLPENVHRAIAIARQHEYFYIDSVRTYAVEEDYEPEWSDKNKNFAFARFEVWQQALRSNSCGVDTTSQTDLNYLIDPQDENCVISLE